MDADLYNAVVEGDISGIEKLSEKIGQVREEDGRTILHLASMMGKTECVRFILTQFANEELLVKMDRNGRTALYYAAQSGHIDAVELLINAARGSLPSSEFEKFIRRADDINGNTALHRAVSGNKVEAVKLLVKADPDHKHSLNSSGESPLYMAAEEGNKDIVKVICESCTSPTFDGFRGQTALHAAIGSPDTIELLINAARGLLPSSDFEKFIRHADNKNSDTALHQAVCQNKVEAVKLLVKADPHHKHCLNEWSQSPLYIAAKHGYKDIVQVICEFCATPSFDGPNGKTALHAAIENSDTEFDAVELLITAAKGLLSSSESEKFIRQVDKDGNTALHLAVERNQVEVVKLLLKADPTHEYSKGPSGTLHYIAVKQGYKDMVELIFRSCTSTFDGPQGKTCLHAAVENGNQDSVRFILDKREDLILKCDDRGWTAADYATSRNFLSILDILIKTENNQFHDYSEYKQFFMDRPHKETAIHRAAFGGHISTVLQLMKFYPDFIWSAVNEDGQNILHIAVDQSHKELAQAIQQQCPNLSQILNTKDKKGNTPLHLIVMRGCFILKIIRHEGVDRNAKNNDNFTPYDLLYLDQGIVADQLKIKEVLEDSEFINQRWNFGLRKNKQVLVSAESPVVPSMRYTKDAKFKEERDLLIKEEIKLYRARINTQIIVTALITTVTFTVGFTIPGGYHDSGEDEGTALHSKKVAFNVFVLADTIALLLSMSSLALYFVASMYQDAEVISKLVDASTLLNIISVVATMLTFVMGIFIVLPNSSVLLITVGVMSSFFLLLIILLLIMVVKDPVEKFRE